MIINAFYIALPPRPPTITVMSRYPDPDTDCGEVIILNCTANPVENLFAPPIIIWIGTNGNKVSAGGSSNPSVDPQTRQLIFSDTIPGTYVCRAVINITEAQIVNFFDETAINLNNNGR